MTELRRFNAVPKIIGADMNVEYEAADEGQWVQADEALTEIAALKESVEMYRLAHEREFDEIAALCAHRDALIAENARLSAPVSHAEISEFFHKDDWGVPCVYRNAFEQVIAARKAAV